jgi:hypothetical protein
MLEAAAARERAAHYYLTSRRGELIKSSSASVLFYLWSSVDAPLSAHLCFVLKTNEVRRGK